MHSIRNDMVKELHTNKLIVIPEQSNLVKVNDSDIESITLESNIKTGEATDQVDMLTDSTGDSEPDSPLRKPIHLPDSDPNCDVLAWENLCESLQTVFPPNEKYTYVIELFQPVPQECFDGAPPFNFSCQIRINISDQVEALEWLDRMQAHSLTTYRVTRTFKAGCSRVLYKTERHCQHFRKKLTPKQIAASAMTKCKKAKRPLTGELRNKKTQCSSKFTLTVQIPTKKQRMAQKFKPYHCAKSGI